MYARLKEVFRGPLEWDSDVPTHCEFCDRSLADDGSFWYGRSTLDFRYSARCERCQRDWGIDSRLGTIGDRYDLVRSTDGRLVWMRTTGLQSESANIEISKLRETIRQILSEDTFEDLSKKYSNIPQYVLKDMFKGSDEPFFKKLDKLTWTLEVIDVNPFSFVYETRTKFFQRSFGARNPFGIPDDDVRMKKQRDFAFDNIENPGTNEPIIVVKTVDGYDLWEGWHRTMTLLSQGNNGGSPDEWDTVPIKAWVGSYRTR